MLGRAGTAYAKKASKFEDSDSSPMSRPRVMSELPHRSAPRVPTRPRTTAAAAVGSETSGAHHRVLGVGRGTAPRRPLHEKKPAGSGGGAGSRVAELEAKLGKAHDQLAEMREQLAAAEKARNDALGAFDEAKKRCAAKQGAVASSAPVEDDHDSVPPDQSQQAEAVMDDVTDDGSEGAVQSMTIDCKSKETEKKTDDGTEVNNVAVINELKTKLMAKDREVYQVRAKLMVKDMEVNELKLNMTARDTAVEELISKLVAKDAEMAALIADSADLIKTASEAADAAGERTAAKDRETEHALAESATREALLAERLAASERAREVLEADARRSRVQSEQWRKAAEEAAAVLGDAPGHNDMRRHGSVGGSSGKIDNQDADGEGSGVRRKSGGAVRMLADLWKKKAQK